MTVLIETQTRKGGRLAVVTFDGDRKPIENVFEGPRWEVQHERIRRIDYWSARADEVTANAVPGPRQ